MDQLVLQGTETAEWHCLIQEAQACSAVQLNESLENYLVFLLMRYTNQPELADSCLGLEFLEGLSAGHRAQQNVLLQQVADKCLLFSGLFPKLAERRRVKISYFVSLGQSAYGTLADITPLNAVGPFKLLSEQFIDMMEVLQATRELNGNTQASLDLLSAHELWQETGSKHALNILLTECQNTPSFTDSHLIH